MNMTDENHDELITEAINKITEKLSKVLLQDFLKLPKELQLNIVLIKTTQLLLSNILCHVATNRDELEKISNEQGVEIKELIFNCAFTGFSNKFDLNKH
jgi:heme/copper-type cytochrome/quinol oxidase subunit 3